MKRHFQIARGSNGDCFRAAVASILDADCIEDIPHFFDEHLTKDITCDEAWDNIRNWLLSNKSLHMLTIPYQDDLDNVLRSMKIQNPGIFYLLQGYSGQHDHCVVAYEDQIVHDPAGRFRDISEVFVGPSSDGYYWVKFFLPKFHGVSECSK